MPSLLVLALAAALITGGLFIRERSAKLALAERARSLEEQARGVEERKCIPTPQRAMERFKHASRMQTD